MPDQEPSLPIIDVRTLIHQATDQTRVADQISSACREFGFFYIVGHGVDHELQQRLENLSRIFFSQDLETKMDLHLDKGGRAWRGYFPVGGELTSGKADLKEGIYFGQELTEDHPLVRSGTPMFGPNLFPNMVNSRETVLEYVSAMTSLGHALMRGIAASLRLDDSYFHDHYTADPLVLFRIFNYPPDNSGDRDNTWGVGEHTDYGLLTILKQDSSGGLEVKSKLGWIQACPIEGSFVCNIGDMLDRLTGGLYRSTPHRVRNPSRSARLSFPFFFDPNFNARIKPIHSTLEDDRDVRWDKSSVHDFDGTYGEYLLNKVSKVFPQLSRKVL